MGAELRENVRYGAIVDLAYTLCFKKLTLLFLQ